jgi:4-hydroxy-3-methylbut-2-enyl diphosphate reductase IspH
MSGMDLVLANPARLLRRRRSRHRDREARDRARSAHRSMCGTKWCTTATWWTTCAQRGAIFVEELDEVPDGATVIFSAHGVSQAVRIEADRRGLKVFDATCPLVTKVHMEVARHCRAGRDVVLIGHAGHPEVEGTMGQWRAEHGAGRIHLVEDVADVEALSAPPE